ncbi:diguanylate cyclase [Xanthomonas sp. AmX2]|nr:diguanylate cyclase [Xanthomonas sp.]
MLGDAVLSEVGRLLAEARRAADVPARMGGEGFGPAAAGADGAAGAARRD